jgi:hypothetical protein
MKNLCKKKYIKKQAGRRRCSKKLKTSMLLAEVARKEAKCVAAAIMY